jgi:AcrR family transcriptional regulator
VASATARRAAIVAALRQCVIAKGYAETSLTDLAKAAHMSVSHLLYYYPSKEQVLLDLSSLISDRVLADVTASRDEPPEERIHVLADNVFAGGVVERTELCIVRELVALAIHRPELRERQREYNRQIMNYLEDLFEKTPRQPGLSPVEAAEIAGAVWMGLINNADYDERLTPGMAKRLFRRTLLSLASLDGSAAVATPVP